MTKPFLYEGRKTSQISLPLGGIGTGSIGLAGNGRLIDWEIFNRPNKNGKNNGFSFFAIKAEHQGKVEVARVLQGDLQPPYPAVDSDFGVMRNSLAGMPHFRDVAFLGEFPLAELAFLDDTVPLDVKLTAYNPFIPLNDLDSSLPGAIFEYTVTNRWAKELDVSLVGNLHNPHGQGAINEWVDGADHRGLRLRSNAYGEADPKYGEMMLTTDAPDTSHTTYWSRGGWFDPLRNFWRALTTPGKLEDRQYPHPPVGEPTHSHDAATLAAHQTLQPGETAHFRFVITWYYPNFVNYWNPGEKAQGNAGDSSNDSSSDCSGPNCSGPDCGDPQWKNYYATQFQGVGEVAAYLHKNIERLGRETVAFKEALFSSTLPVEVLDAISSNLSILKSPTCIRLTDGTLYGFEGCHANSGCCEGSCTHVWNYAQAAPFLFPALERSMRDVDYKSNLFDNGKLSFRMMLPMAREKWAYKAAADGQMGGIIKVFREWRISGDTEWLKRIWPQVKRALEYAWDPTNEDWWDKDADGVMEGIQHHTLDVEMYGPNAWLSGMYQTALLAASKMAEALDDPAGSHYYELYENGRQWVDEHLFNGEFFYQKIDLTDERYPVDPELGEHRYQMGEACHIDQVLAQWHAHIAGLGYVFDAEKVATSLRSIYKYNFIPSLRDYPNACRIYGLNDEGGLLICTWPKDNAPKVPLQYGDECMNGFEYQAACHMIYEGMLEEGLTVVKAIRGRYDGENRNPWNEYECGNNYARSMASYSLLLAYSGFAFDMVDKAMGFDPKLADEDFKSFWSLGSGWGTVSYSVVDMDEAVDTVELKLDYGRLELRKFTCGQAFVKRSLGSVMLNHSEVAWERGEDGGVVFVEKVRLSSSDVLVFKFLA